MDVRYSVHPDHCLTLSAADLRREFLIENLFTPGGIRLVYSHVDRAIAGGAMPLKQPLRLEAGRELAADYFAQRREIGVINIGGAGTIELGTQSNALNRCEFLYIGRGQRDIAFLSDNPSSPARFYFVSYPAHAAHPTKKLTLADADVAKLGTEAEANRRTIYKVIRPGGLDTCQLVMGMTTLAEGSVWNTMSAHTHERRSEIYMYFDLPDPAVVFHLMGRPEETRHIVVRDGQAVISPSWSIHSGVGTRNYTFVWSMGGENQEFGDMDPVAMQQLT